MTKSLEVEVDEVEDEDDGNEEFEEIEEDEDDSDDEEFDKFEEELENAAFEADGEAGSVKSNSLMDELRQALAIGDEERANELFRRDTAAIVAAVHDLLPMSPFVGFSYNESFHKGNTRLMDRQQEQPLIGESQAFLEVLEHVSRVAQLNRPVLVIGERGTGKELVAARIHYLSPRWDRPFVKLNCAALAESLLETELFGHEAGSFTGATRRRLGRFELANEGSMFLDELANTSDRVQEKVLRVIEYGELERVGGNDTIRTDVRIIGATNEDLPALADAGPFPRRPAGPAGFRCDHPAALARAERTTSCRWRSTSR